MVEAVLTEIRIAGARREVKLSSFGSFVVRKRAAHRPQPEDRQGSADLARRVMVFKPSAILKQRINGMAETAAS